MREKLLSLSWEKIKALDCWNDRCSLFEERSNSVGAYLGGVSDAYSLFIELINSKKFYAKTRISAGNIFSEKEFINIFKLKEHADEIVRKNSNYSLPDLYWTAVEDVYHIFRFLDQYTHPRLKNGDKVLVHPEMSDQDWAYFTVSIGAEINAQSAEGFYLTTAIVNKRKKKMIYLDELFGWDALAEGHFLTIKKLKKHKKT